MFGPFRSGDLVAKYFREINVGDFLLAPEGIFLAVHWSTGVPNPAKDRLIQFDPQGLPKEVGLWHGDQECLALKFQPKESRFEFSVAGPGCSPSEGCIGINTSGDLALTFKQNGGGAFLQLNKAELRTAQPLGGFIWSKSWRLELVLGEDGHCRIPLGENQ